jgi:hypothetical protein
LEELGIDTLDQKLEFKTLLPNKNNKIKRRPEKE